MLMEESAEAVFPSTDNALHTKQSERDRDQDAANVHRRRPYFSLAPNSPRALGKYHLGENYNHRVKREVQAGVVSLLLATRHRDLQGSVLHNPYRVLPIAGI